jgi:hypothetical protein
MTFTRIIGPEELVAGFRILPALDQPWVQGFLSHGKRLIPQVRTKLDGKDRLGGLAVRLNWGRNNYRVMPGLYACGNPNRESPVLVSANYKLSFDALRMSLPNLDAWILVLDTKGINVWCAAGKGSFGTAELINKIKTVHLRDIVEHRNLVLPQLAAPGVSAPELARRLGWRITWGPVRASDLPTFLDTGMRATPEMRRVRFGMRERLTLVPVELVQAWPILAAGLVVTGIAALISSPDSSAVLSRTLMATFGTWVVAGLGFPALLPWLPGKAFALKGALLGLVWGLTAVPLLAAGPWFGPALIMATTAGLSFTGMNFTGASTFTSQTGALFEVNRAIIPQTVAMLAATVLAILGLVLRGQS